MEYSLLHNESKQRKYVNILRYMVLVTCMVCGLVLIHDGLTTSTSSAVVSSILDENQVGGYSKNSYCAEDGDFQCATGQCIAGKYLCDGEPDCPDSSDENEKDCTEWGFTTYKVEKAVAGGIPVSQQAQDDIKEFKENENIAYLVMKIDKHEIDTNLKVWVSGLPTRTKDLKEAGIILEDWQSESWENLKHYLLSLDAAFVGCRIKHKGKFRTLYVMWINDDKANITNKMKYSGEKDRMKKYLTGMKIFQANDKDDLDYRNMMMNVFRIRV